MNFVRSDFVMDRYGVRQQYNKVTTWVDGSQVYGPSDTQARSLRSLADGKLKAVISEYILRFIHSITFNLD